MNKPTPTFMNAIAWTKYGPPDVLQLKKFAKPFPLNNEILIKIKASSVTAADSRLRAFKVPMGFWLPARCVYGLSKPRNKISGTDLAGEIESVGEGVTLFKSGDKVFGTSGMKLGANAEYICLSENAAIVKMPNNLSYEQAAAAVFGGITAIHFLLNKANIQSGQNILINGASGSVGTASIQLANYLGAEVTGICSTSNIDLIESLGAQNVIDYSKVDLTKYQETYDFILDTVGNMNVQQCKKMLAKNGKAILINVGLRTNLRSIFDKNLICGVATENKDKLIFLRERLESKDIVAVIDKIYPLEQTAYAHEYVDAGHKKGNVVISC